MLLKLIFVTLLTMKNLSDVCLNVCPLPFIVIFEYIIGICVVKFISFLILIILFPEPTAPTSSS